MKACKNEHRIWELYENGEIVNAKKHHCLDVQGEDGNGKVHIRPCDLGKDQRWKVNDKDEKWDEVVNRESDKCLDVKGTDGKGNVKISPCNDGKDQQWKFVDL